MRQFAPIMFPTDRSLDVQREEFKRGRLIAMPIAGLIIWLIIGLLGIFLSTGQAALALFIGTGSIAYLGMFISRFTGEHFLDRSRPKNTFDALFFLVVAMALQAYAIAIPFFLITPTSLPLTVGVLSGMMWLPMSWMLQHWIGIVHGALRTAGGRCVVPVPGPTLRRRAFCHRRPVCVCDRRARVALARGEGSVKRWRQHGGGVT